MSQITRTRSVASVINDFIECVNRVLHTFVEKISFQVSRTDLQHGMRSVPKTKKSNMEYVYTSHKNTLCVTYLSRRTNVCNAGRSRGCVISLTCKRYHRKILGAKILTTFLMVLLLRISFMILQWMKYYKL